MNKRISAGVIVVLAVAGVVCFWSFKADTKTQAPRIYSVKRRSLFDLLNVHASPKINLSIGERTFRNVMGHPPYYLALPKGDSVLVVTREPGGNTAIHIVNLATGHVIDIPSFVDFGSGIGLTNGTVIDRIERVEPGMVIVARQREFSQTSIKTVYHLNLHTAKIDEREEYRYDPQGNLINSYKGSP